MKPWRNLNQIREILGLGPVDPVPGRSGEIGSLYLSSNRYADAIAEFRAALDGSTGADRECLADLREKLGWCYFWTGEYDEAKRVIGAIDKSGDPSPGLLLLEGRIALERGDAEGSSVKILRALDRAINADRWEWIGPCRSMLGIIAQREGRSDEARGHFDDAMLHYRIAGDDEGECRTAIHLGTLSKSECRWEEALRYLDRARRRSEEKGFFYLYGSASLNRGNLSYRLGRFDDAEATAGEAERVFREIGYRLGIVRASIALARIAFAVGRTDDFRLHLNVASENCRADRFPRERVLIERLEGRAAVRAGHPEEGERRFTKALRLAREIASGGDLDLAVTLDLAELKLRRGEPAEAERLALDATGPLAAVADPALEGRQRRILAETAATREEWGKAEEEIIEAVRYFERVGYRREQAAALVVAASIEAGKNGAASDEKVLADLLGAKKLWIELGDERSAAGVTIDLARHWIRMNVPGQARGSLNEAIRSLEKVGDEKGIAEAEALLDIIEPEGGSGDAAFARILTRDAATRETLRVAARVSRYPITVLIEGETGTGKELLARALHESSPRAKGPFVTINCASLPEQLLESELFGYVKGSFTGAIADRKGLFEEADGGTILLDEIGKAGPHVQRSLLHVLDRGMIRPVGSNHQRRVDVRVICATSNMRLRRDMDEDRFLKDLYYRINDITLDLPPLRERKGDVHLLTRHFLDRCRRELGRPDVDFSDDVTGLFREYRWPGNVRELEKTVLRAVILAPGDLVDSSHLPPEIAQSGISGASSKGSLKQEIESLERARVLEALDRTGWNRTRAARFLGLSLRGLRNKIARYRLEEGKEQ